MPLRCLPSRPAPWRARRFPLTLIRALFGVIIAILRSCVSAFLVFGVAVLSSAAALAVVAVVAVSLTGAVSLRIARRRRQNGS